MATSKEENLNLSQPAYALAEADARDFIPILPTLTREALFEVAQTYNAILENGERPKRNTAKSRLITAIGSVIQERVVYTAKQYQEALEAYNQSLS